MTTLHISLPDKLIEFVQERVTRGDYDTANDYLLELIYDDQLRKAQEKLDALLKEGFDSGQSTPMTAQDWDEIRQPIQR
jgi:antitoxin ParD1/3/4